MLKGNYFYRDGHGKVMVIPSTAYLIESITCSGLAMMEREVATPGKSEILYRKKQGFHHSTYMLRGKSIEFQLK